MKKIITGITKALLWSYILTVIMILLLSLVMYKIKFDENQCYAGILIIYAMACCAGGMVYLKLTEWKRIPAGIFFALAYIVVLTIISVIVNKAMCTDMATFVKSAGACVSGALLGTMIIRK